MRKVIAVVVRAGMIISVGSNDHKEECKREGYPSGIGYELCKWCDYDNHAEANALRDIDAEGATLYLIGHDYVCSECQAKCDQAGVRVVIIG